MRTEGKSRAIALLVALGLAVAAPALADPGHRADEVIVIEPEPEAAEAGTASDRIVDPADVALTPIKSGDELLRLVPGLHISQHGSEGKAPQIFLRGFDAVHGADLEVEVGGAPINEMSNIHGHGYVDIGFVVPEVIASIHAHKGSFKLSQGLFGTAGSVEIELGVEAARRGHRVGYEVGTTNRHRMVAVAAPASLPEPSFLAIEAMSDDGFGENRAAQRLVGIGQHRFALGADRQLDAFATAYAARFGEPGALPLAAVESGRLGFYDAFAADHAGRSRRLLTGLRFSDRGERRRLEARAHLGWRGLELAENFTGYLVNPEMGDSRGQRHDALAGGAHLRIERDFASGALTAVVGGGGRFDTFDQAEDMLDDSGAPWMASRDLAGRHLAGELAAGARIELGAARAELGARLDALHIEATDRLSGQRGSEAAARISPRLATSWAASQHLALFAAYGRGLRPPEARSVTGEGEGGITTSDSVELGTRARLGDRVSVGLAGFGIWVDREYVFDHASGANLARDATRRLGLELDAEITPLDWISLRGDLTAVSARFVDSGAPVPYAPRLSASAEARLRHPRGLEAGAQLFAVAARPLAHGATGSGLAVMNLLATYRLGWSDLGLHIDNLWNARWREAEFHYASRLDPSEPASELPRTHFAPGRPFGARLSLTAWF